MRKAWYFCFLLAGLVAGCDSNPPADALPEVSETLDAIGRRLSQSLSESRLTAIAARGPELLSYLNCAERDALARGYLRIRSTGPVMVHVAAPESVDPVLDPRSGFRGHRRDPREPRRPLAPLPQGVSPRDGLDSGSMASIAARRLTTSFFSGRLRTAAALGGFDHAGPRV